MKSYKKLEKKIEEVSRINNIVNALYWDMSTNTPLLSIQNKKEEISYLKQLSYQKLISEDVGDLIQQATEKKSVLNNWQLANLKEIQRKYDLSVCIGTENQKEYIKNTIECEAVWYGAKENNDFAKIFPYLKNVIISTRNVSQQKKIYYPNKTIYEILIDQYDSGRNIPFLKEVYSKIKNQLPGLIQEIQQKQNSENLIPIPTSLSIDQQFLLNKKIAKLMGFDFKKGSIDNANHYFCGGSPGDVRLLVKKNSNFLDNMMKVIHEVGHGLYEQNLPNNYKNQPVGKAAGMAAHESQSLIMEIHIARSREFMAFLSKILRDEYNLKGNEYSEENLYRHVTRVAPNSIRLESDELTYLLHIILRCEIEEELIEQVIDLKDLPEVWNSKMQQYLGITPQPLKKGCMQDIHWFKGYFGYFPTYCMEAILSSTMINKIIQKDHMSFEDIKKGDFSSINQWLNTNIRNFGALRKIEELVKNAGGGKISADVDLDDIKKRYLKK